MATVNADSLVMLPDGQWVSAGVIAFFGGYQSSGDQVVVPDNTVVMLPGGGSMTAGAINTFQSQPTLGSGDLRRGWDPSENVQLPTQEAIDVFGDHLAVPEGSRTSSTRTETIPGTPGTFRRGSTPIGTPAADLPEWAKAAFFNVSGLTWDDVAAGIQGGTQTLVRTYTTNSYQLRDGGTAATPEQLASQQAIGQLAPGQGSASQRDAYALVAQTLNQFGLGGLADWAWGQIVSGASSNETILSMQNLDAWKQRFAGNTLRQQAGLSTMSPDQYLAYEEQVRSLFRAHGLPIGFYDQASDIAYLIGQNVSPDELNARITQAYDTVATAPPAIRQAFADYFGASSDQALAAFVLDPDKARPLLLKQVQTAEVGGTGRQYGFNLGRQRAGELVDFGVDRQRALQGFSQLDSLKPLLTETISETTDLTAENEGVAAVFDLPGDARRKLEERRDERVAAFSGAGGALSATKGLLGLTEAR